MRTSCCFSRELRRSAAPEKIKSDGFMATTSGIVRDTAAVSGTGRAAGASDPSFVDLGAAASEIRMSIATRFVAGGAVIAFRCSLFCCLIAI